MTSFGGDRKGTFLAIYGRAKQLMLHITLTVKGDVKRSRKSRDNGFEDKEGILMIGYLQKLQKIRQNTTLTICVG